MKKLTKTTIIMLIAALMATQIPTVHAANLPIVQVYFDDIHLKGGEINELTLNIENTGDFKVFDVQAFLTSSVSGITVLTEQHKVWNEISAEKTKTYNPQIYVDDSVEFGAYTLTLTFTYKPTQASAAVTPISVNVGVFVDEVFVPRITFSHMQESIKVKAGIENDVEFQFVSNWDEELTDLQFLLSTSTSSITVTENMNILVDSLLAGETLTINPVVSVTEGTPLGTYTISASVTYQDLNGSRFHQSFSLPITVDVAATREPIISFIPVQESIKVKSGTENYVEYLFTSNWDETITDLQFLLATSTSSISVTEVIVPQIDSLLAGDSITISPVVSVSEGIQLGTYTISATATYQDLNGREYQQEFSLPVNVDSAVPARNTIVTIDSMEVVQESIRPGDVFSIKLTVECSGSDSYSLLSTMSFVSMSSISPVTPTTVSLGDLEAGNNVTTSYQLLAAGDISAGQYPVTTTITYTDYKGQPGSLSETFTILVDGLIEFSLLDVPTEKVPVGEAAELEADLLLIGTESVQFVSIGVVEDGVIERVSGSDEYIGAVDPDSPIPFDIKYKVSDDASEGGHELKLSVHYRDHLNREHEEELSIDVEIGGVVEDAPEPQQGGFWAWIRRLLGLGP